ncbi:MAG: acyl-CoA dehydrogenase family protein [Deltaproteobacteria bacterium]|nr:acyl-CoA dehydrogenase family protein [Deltaproteobacteria bacterium]
MSGIYEKLSPQMGAGFIFDRATEKRFFTPEDFDEDTIQFRNTAQDFVINEVMPNIERIDEHDYELLVSLLKKAGELGLLMCDIPERFGGAELSKAASMAISEVIGMSGSFSVALMAHTGIGTLPILFFGNDKQREKYLPKLATGELLGAYALTETGSGSDALAAKTKATLSEDGKYYILNGSKQFITNAGFADVFTVFAKIDGDKFTGFIIERGTPGLTIGKEENKMGIRGSSTCPLILEDCKVPVENILGEIGKGHKIAFNILNVGRFKLGVICIGAAKDVFKTSIKYAKERKQFGKPIESFGMIREKFANMAIQIYAGETVSYRVAGLMDKILHNIDKSAPDAQQRTIEGIEEFAIEDSIMKIFGSEILDYVVDEGVQIHGGYGYTREYSVERAYRDSRINRLFEGTNEINRLVIISTIIRRISSGKINISEVSKRMMEELKDPSLITRDIKDSPLSDAVKLTELTKRGYLYLFNKCIQKFGETLIKEQEYIRYLADITIAICAMDSVCGRALNSIELLGPQRAKIQVDMANAFVLETYEKSFSELRLLASSITSGEELEKDMKVINMLYTTPQSNIIALKRSIAQYFVDKEEYRL